MAGNYSIMVCVVGGEVPVIRDWYDRFAAALDDALWYLVIERTRAGDRSVDFTLEFGANVTEPSTLRCGERAIPIWCHPLCPAPTDLDNPAYQALGNPNDLAHWATSTSPREEPAL